MNVRWLSASAYAGMFVFGVVMALLGAVLPVVFARIGFDLAGAGNLFLAMNGGMLVTMFAAGPLMDRFGKKPPMVAGPVLVAAALAVIAGAEGYRALVVAVVLLGVGGGALNGATNTLIADLHADPHRKNAALNVLGIFFGIGAIFLPFTIGSLLEALGLAAILYVTAALAMAAAILAAVLAFPAPLRSAHVPMSEVWRLARNPLVLAFGFLLFFESGNEFIVGGYASSFLTREVGMSIRSASLLLALYWGAVIVARVWMSRLLLRAKGQTVVLASALAAAGGVALLLASREPWHAGVALAVVGLGLASIFPTTLGLAGARFEEYSGTVFGILFAVALAGGMSLPWALGQIANSAGFRVALWLPVGGFLAIAAIQKAMK